MSDLLTALNKIEEDAVGGGTPERCAMLSMAISLKRIADRLDAQPQPAQNQGN